MKITAETKEAQSEIAAIARLQAEAVIVLSVAGDKIREIEAQIYAKTLRLRKDLFSKKRIDAQVVAKAIQTERVNTGDLCSVFINAFEQTSGQKLYPMANQPVCAKWSLIERIND